MPNDYFHFQQFTIEQSDCAMKVGTDGVLLGAWADIEHAEKILDIGTGTGLLALMSAQRSSADITAVEMHLSAAAQAFRNFNSSPWAQRITLHCMRIQECTEATDQLFDAIISNPPYFNNARRAESAGRSAARHNDELPFEELLTCTVKLLAHGGSFFCILPADEHTHFTALACNAGLYPKKEMITRTHNGKKPMRVLFEFTRQRLPVERRELIVHKEGASEYSDEYKNITKGFYLNF